MVAVAPRAARGFTAIELMTVLVIVGVLAAIGLPGLRDLVVTSQVRSTAGDLRAALVRARSEAMLRNAQVDVVPLSGSWSNGWQVVAGGSVIEERGPASKVSITPAVAATVTYRLDGRPVAGVQGVTVAPDSGNAVRARCVYVDPAGRPVVRVDKDFDASNGCE
jgi:type IV fimbrial biogenesis protein FimT